MTAGWIAAAQRTDGAIPWYPGGPLDPWNHVEAAMGLTVAGLTEQAAAAYDWLAAVQNADGSWFAGYGADAERVGDSNVTAYVAVGVRHHLLATGDTGFARRLWPVVEGALDYVLSLRRPDGAIRWREDSADALVTGCSSIAHALRHGQELAGGHDRWARAAAGLRAALTGRPDAFLPKPHAMDWYYPVLTSVITGGAATARLADGWDRFVVPGLGVRCVHHQPWVTGGETAELALTLAARGERARAARLLADIGARLRHDDGSYWTGYQFADDALWPDERTTWTAGAMLLARAALAGDPATLAVFGPAGGPRTGPVG
ncbi:prenyltransferase/squalene oxidase repeat-containing protein [Amycolatopsis suaedae]|uniref:Prenyltransferase n=1 Tax=Amycolatopsis suaedae TaxID=2510978 RepID=A0A4Q7JES8_9PSEU|nr:prenyltransferase/squalene oxidase repeat-containing protein [Amycolatopsis suaedae]RZQ65666.1 prenyltransferase [Amycolatopsis suaedae]